MNVSSETSDRFVTDLLGVREALGACSTDFSKLRKFLQSPDCLKQIAERKKLPCCDESSGHLHTLIDGLEVVVKFSQEKLTQGDPCRKLVDEAKKHEVEKGLEKKSHEANRGEAKEKLDLTRAGARASVKTLIESKVPEKEETVDKRPTTAHAMKQPDKSTISATAEARSREAWYGKSLTVTGIEEPFETFTSENAPRIRKSSNKESVKVLRDSKPVRFII